MTLLGADAATSTNGSSANNVFRIGGNNPATTLTTGAVFNGGGTLVISNPAANFAMDNTTSTNVAANTSLDMKALAAFSATVNEFRVGYGSNTAATLNLSPNNTIVANALTVGSSNATGNGSYLSDLNLGTVNVVDANTITIGADKGSGAISFQSGLTNPSLVIRGAAGGSTRVANMNMAVTALTPASILPAT